MPEENQKPTMYSYDPLIQYRPGVDIDAFTQLGMLDIVNRTKDIILSAMNGQVWTVPFAWLQNSIKVNANDALMAKHYSAYTELMLLINNLQPLSLASHALENVFIEYEKHHNAISEHNTSSKIDELTYDDTYHVLILNLIEAFSELKKAFTAHKSELQTAMDAYEGIVENINDPRIVPNVGVVENALIQTELALSTYRLLAEFVQNDYILIMNEEDESANAYALMVRDLQEYISRVEDSYNPGTFLLLTERREANKKINGLLVRIISTSGVYTNSLRVGADGESVTPNLKDTVFGIQDRFTTSIMQEMLRF